MIITVKNSIFFLSDDHHDQCGILVMVIIIGISCTYIVQTIAKIALF